jgi:hypothetical protein
MKPKLVIRRCGPFGLCWIGRIGTRETLIAPVEILDVRQAVEAVFSTPIYMQLLGQPQPPANLRVQ